MENHPVLPKPKKRFAERFLSETAKRPKHFSEQHLRQSAKGYEHWKVLLFREMITAEEAKRGQELRAEMSERDWALWNVCVRLDPDWRSPFLTVSDMVRIGRSSWRDTLGDWSDQSILPDWRRDNKGFYLYHHMEELLRDLLERGWIEVVPEEEVKRRLDTIPTGASKTSCVFCFFQ